MAPRTPSPEAAAALHELAVNRSRKTTVSERARDLSAERIALYRRAREAGATLRAIGDAAGVSDVAVLRALEADDERERAPSA